MVNIFRQEGLEITIDTNQIRVDYLDVQAGNYQPYTKPGTPTIYVNKSSDHPSHTFKQIPLVVLRRLSELSCNEEVFNKACPPNQQALLEAVYEI